MKRINPHQYNRISSFDDFRREKELLQLRGRIIDTKLSLAFLQIKQNFSPSNLILSLARKYVMPEITKLLGGYSETNKDNAAS